MERCKVVMVVGVLFPMLPDLDLVGEVRIQGVQQVSEQAAFFQQFFSGNIETNDDDQNYRNYGFKRIAFKDSWAHDSLRRQARLFADNETGVTGLIMEWAICPRSNGARVRSSGDLPG